MDKRGNKNKGKSQTNTQIDNGLWVIGITKMNNGLISDYENKKGFFEMLGRDWKGNKSGTLAYS